MEKDVERSRASALASIDQEQCRAEGGLIRGVGMFGTPACVKPFPDADKSCSDKSRRPPGFESVSYTHLDVYKRQI